MKKDKLALKAVLNKKYKIDILIKSIKLMDSNKVPYLASIVLSLISLDISVIIKPIAVKRIVNAIEFSDGSLFADAVILMVISTLLFWVVLPFSSYITGRINLKTMFRVRMKITNHMVRFPVKYYDDNSTGECLSLLSSDLNCLQGIYSYHFYKTLENFVVGSSGLLMLYIIEWRLALFATAFGLVSVITGSFTNEKLGELGCEIQSCIGKTTTVFLNVVSGIKIIKLFDSREQMRRKMSASLENELENKIKLASKQASLVTMLEIMNGLSIFGIILIGGLMVRKGLTDWGSVVAISGLQLATGDLFFKLPVSLANMQSVLAGVERVIAVLAEKEETIDCEKYKVTLTEECENRKVLDVKHLSFSYNKKDFIFKDVSLELSKGELVIVKGHSGCGKSTLIKIILGLYKPQKGLITISKTESGGFDSEVSFENWRDHIAYVPQSANLFAGTILENIVLNAANADMNKVMQVCKSVGLHEFIMDQPEGYNTTLNDNGESLSVGQRQRLSIARALMKDADILLLDEITSSLDMDNEINIMKLIKSFAEKKAILMISHKETTIGFGDRIVDFASFSIK